MRKKAEDFEMKKIPEGVGKKYGTAIGNCKICKEKSTKSAFLR